MFKILFEVVMDISADALVNGHDVLLVRPAKNTKERINKTYLRKKIYMSLLVRRPSESTNPIQNMTCDCHNSAMF